MNILRINPNFCIECNEEMIIIQNKYTCTSCATVNNSIIFNFPMVYSNKIVYTRLNHFKFKLNKLNAIDSDYIPISVINNIKKHEFNSIIELRNVMKQLKYGYYYKNIHLIYLIIKKNRLIDMSIDFKNKLTKMFELINLNYFQCHNKRIQFINYNYFIFKLCCLLNRYDYAKHIPFISNHFKTINSYDNVFQQICDKLHWDFTSTFTELNLIKNIL